MEPIQRQRSITQGCSCEGVMNGKFDGGTILEVGDVSFRGTGERLAASVIVSRYSLERFREFRE